MAFLVLLLASCAPSPQASGSGVQTSVMNRGELADIYVPLNPFSVSPHDQMETRQFDTGRHIRIADMNLLVHNRGYSDSLVALYVTGYDPNLFTVRPHGPFVLQEGSRYCYRDVIIESLYDYSVFATCAIRDDVYVGGGFSQDGDDTVLDLSGYGLNIGKWLDKAFELLTSRESSFFESFNDRIGGIHIDCQIPIARGEGSSLSSRCSLTSDFIDFLNRPDTRGSLLLALYGPDVSNCQNNCVLVPSPRLPRNFLSGDKSDYPGGEMYTVDYGIYLNENRWPSNYFEHDQLFQISACYLYTTYATPVVCIDAAPQNSDAAICRPGVQQINHGQPAPLRISHIDQVNQGPRVMFTIHVENTMGGRVFNPGAIDFCAPGSPEVYSRELRDVAKVIDARVIGDSRSLDCRDGTIRMQNNRGQITCFYDIPAQAYRSGAYQTSLNIEIGYLYRDIQTVQTTIHRI